MKLPILSSRYIIFSLILSLSFVSSAQTNHDQYLIPAISGTGMTQDFQSLNSINIQFKGITVQTDDTSSYLYLKWHPVTFFKIEQDKALQNSRINQLKSTKNLVALWDFKEPEGQAKKAIGKGEFPLTEQNGTLPRMSEGPLSGYSIQFGNKAFLSLPNAAVGQLNIHGMKQGVTVLAWVKWTGEQTGFVGGMWNEYQDGGKRQYGLFVSLPHYNGKNQVCGHVSQTGKPTPPFPYSCDYAASKQEVPANQWVCIAFTYDGKNIKSYLNGIFEQREPELINNTKGFEGYPDGLVQSKNPYHFPYGLGNNGSDFTVGAVLLKSGMGNFFKGQIGGLAVYDRALSAKELKQLAE